MRTYFAFLSFLLLILPLPEVWAQKTFTIRGRVLDATTGEALTGATIVLKEKPSGGTVADATGNYKLFAPAGTYTLVAQYIGYNTYEEQLQLDQNIERIIRITPAAYSVQEVEILAERKPPLTETATMGELELPLETIKNLPVLFGETDILKTIQLLPGVKSGGEGSTGFYVRGGGADQNMVTLDDAVVYNPGHLFNFFSVFNSDALGSTTLFKGNMPARYGGRLSSVLDISMKEGDMSEYKVNGGIGLISSKLLVQGPIAKEKASFLLAGRRTYIDALANPFLRNTEQGGVPYYFYDLNGKLSYHITPKDKLTLSGYYGRDVGDLVLSDGRFKADFFWGNASATANWRHTFNDKFNLNLSGVYSNYNFRFGWDFGGFNTVVTTGVSDYTLKADFDFKPSANHHLQYGALYTYHYLQPRVGSATNEEGLSFDTNRVRPKQGHEAALYLSDDWNITDRLLLNVGMRASGYVQSGPFTLYTYDENALATDSTNYGSGDIVKTYFNLEPRLSARYKLTETSSLKAAFSQNAQYLHLVSNAYTTLPLDVWVPSSVLAPPQRATQVAIGYFESIKQNEYEGSVEVYYKDLQNQLEYREGFAPGPSNRDLEYEFVSGNGESYGVELFMRKNYGLLQGWIGYTLSYTDRTFHDLNNGNAFPARFDRRHDASVVAIYKYSPRWTFGGSFVYGTGDATTMPVRKYSIEGNINYQYGSRNSFRMEPTHRLDLSATLEAKPSSKLNSSWNFSVYNVYGRRNPFLYYIDNEGESYSIDQRVQAKKVSIIPFPLPSVTWNFNF
ncbi:TonB-dependent receptor [Pontibacter harenae]|uniref:TonB-dependent receptor n=1 Tax=Pontibacter harenae TaxID=2894083 RepID=UPI001E556D63|nr:TonB-dependent receptor [Pontibacter harenae]MCC9167045.1 TonB-dependent receptor [Pontibacter harenae]